MNRNRLLTCLLIITPLGFGTKLYSDPGSSFVRGYAGGILYEVFWVFVVLLLWQRLAPWKAAAGVFAVTSALETAQLWHPPFLESIRATFLGHAVLGSTFSWLDFPCYAAGCVLAMLLTRLCRSGETTSGSEPSYNRR